MLTIGERIRECRLKASMTQEDLANRLGYKSRSTINKIELGINDISQSKLKRIADALDVSPAYLMGWVDNSDDKDAPIPTLQDAAMVIFAISRNVEIDYDNIPKEHHDSIKMVYDFSKRYLDDERFKTQMDMIHGREEQKIIDAYHDNPEIHDAINKLLGIESASETDKKA